MFFCIHVYCNTYMRMVTQINWADAELLDPFFSQALTVGWDSVVVNISHHIYSTCMIG